MSLEQIIDSDLKQALKNREETRVTTLRMLRSAFKNLAIELKKETLEDKEAITVIKKELKKRKDASQAFESGDRPELAAKEDQEAEILSKYMPDMISEDEIAKIIDGIITSGAQNFGEVMKQVMAQTQGMADGKVVGQLVKQKLDS
ncbi:GatB/YqeY domain-containing protein [bacterium]|nr:GatB/YqeY domain-containing protein [bacterium]